MFSRSDARLLRQNLGAMEFLSSDAAQDPVLSDISQQQYASYANFYGLNFSEVDPVLAAARTSIGTFSSNDYELVCQHFVPSTLAPRKTVFLLHGYFDHAGLYRHMIRHLLQQNIAVVIFDLPGHGLSSGATASIRSFQEYGDALIACLKLAEEQEVALPWAALGQSTGGAIFMDTLLEGKVENDLNPNRSFQEYILLGPLLRPKHWSRSKVLFSLSKLFVAATPRKFSKNSHDTEFLDFLESKDELQSRILPRDWVLAMIDYINRFEKAPSQMQSLQIIQGKGDGTVEWETNVPKILEKFSGSEVHWIEEAGHHLVNESMPYRSQVFAIVDRILK